jgi:hypothetical protein
MGAFGADALVNDVEEFIPAIPGDPHLVPDMIIVYGFSGRGVIPPGPGDRPSAAAAANRPSPSPHLGPLEAHSIGQAAANQALSTHLAQNPTDWTGALQLARNAMIQIAALIAAEDEEAGCRIYLDPYLTSYIDVRNQDVIHKKDNYLTGEPSIGGSYFWILAEATILHGSTGRASSSFQAGLLDSRIGPKPHSEPRGLAAHGYNRATNHNASREAYCGYPEASGGTSTQQGYSCPYTICCSGPG